MKIEIDSWDGDIYAYEVIRDLKTPVFLGAYNDCLEMTLGQLERAADLKAKWTLESQQKGGE